jgi:hypothetical protein
MSTNDTLNGNEAKWSAIRFDIARPINETTFVIEKGLVVPNGTTVQQGLVICKGPQNDTALFKQFFGIRKKGRVVHVEEEETFVPEGPVSDSSDGEVSEEDEDVESIESEVESDDD